MGKQPKSLSASQFMKAGGGGGVEKEGESSPSTSQPVRHLKVSNYRGS